MGSYKWVISKLSTIITHIRGLISYIPNYNYP